MAEQQEKKPKIIEYHSVKAKLFRLDNLILFGLLVATWVVFGLFAGYAYRKDVALEASLHALPTTHAANVSSLSQATIDNLTERLQTLESQTAALHTAVATMPTAINGEVSSDALGQLQATVAELAKGIAGSKRSSLVVTAALLRERIQLGKPYEKELQTVMTLGKDEPFLPPILKLLQPSALAGVATVAELQQEFEMLIPVMLRADASQAASLTEEIKQKFSSLVTIRKVGADVEGDTTEAIIARAEAQLTQGQIANALRELEKLTGAAADSASPWRIKAMARLKAEETADALLRHAVQVASSPSDNL